MEESVKLMAFWPLVLACVFFIVWLIRLEAKILYMEKDLNAHKESTAAKEQSMWEKIDTINTSITSILQSLGRIEGALSVPSRKDP